MENTSDMIEAYLKQLLAQAQASEIEIKRSELAERFSVVPSQINYVIKTRFNSNQGFDVESKRGGGGYIKIVKFDYSSKHDFLSDFYQRLPYLLTSQDMREVLQMLFEENILTQQEGNLLLVVLSSDKISDLTRGHLLHEVLQRLDRN
ncbi:CtsR family transcriptional regulator [Lactovum miscens]|uniref:Transcriptional regulator CtsR n=1 Tax=Lactovum miscens TaxID=190387 RepID=A0A841C9L1_9LACT|nr:CtsR family transcriptional regulator [Lactovum miscens]MBB5888079.1 transcriptional regulator CtsR [Lactovum miscens]